MTGTKLKKEHLPEDFTIDDVMPHIQPFQGTADIGYLLYRILKLEDRVEALEKK